MSDVGKLITIRVAGRFAGAKGIVAGYDHSQKVGNLLIALTDGGIVSIVNLPGESYTVDNADATEMAALPAYPLLSSAEEIEAASRDVAPLYQLMTEQMARLLEIENEITAIQAELAKQIRGAHSDLYHAQTVTGDIYRRHAQRLQDSAIAVWMSNGQPAKGKTIGATQIKENKVVTHYDAAQALTYCKTQAQGLIVESVDQKKFEAAVKAGTFSPPPEVITIEIQPTAVILKSQFAE